MLAPAHAARRVAEAAAEGAIEGRVLAITHSERDVADTHPGIVGIREQRLRTLHTLALDKAAERLAGLLEQAMDIAVGHAMAARDRFRGQPHLREIGEDVRANAGEPRGTGR